MHRRARRPRFEVLLILAVLMGCTSPESGEPELQTRRFALGHCPSTPDTSEMIELPEGFCIDATEVTRGQYEVWLASAPDPATGGAACADNASLEPTCSWPPGDNPDLPVACVDWCDAAAYCLDNGKRLCGTIGGGAMSLADHADPARSEWFAACSSGGRHAYTYGDAEDPLACRGGFESNWGTVEVASQSDCQSPEAGYVGVFDLSGNAMEWTAACSGEGADAECRVRGGSYNNHGESLRCDAGRALLFPRDAVFHGVAFRCCAD